MLVLVVLVLVLALLVWASVVYSQPENAALSVLFASSWEGNIGARNEKVLGGA